LKKQYQKPDLEQVMLETQEPITAWLGLASNPFLKLAFEDDATEEATVIDL